MINFSISGGDNPYADAVELAFLDAYDAGVFVAASAGNSGPGAETVAHRGPWVTTVAASTTDRAFKNTVTVNGGGSTLTLNGTSLTGGVSTPLPVVDAGAPYDRSALSRMRRRHVHRQDRRLPAWRPAGQGRVQKGYNVLQGGAAGMVLYNNASAT